MTVHNITETKYESELELPYLEWVRTGLSTHNQGAQQL